MLILQEFLDQAAQYRTRQSAQAGAGVTYSVVIPVYNEEVNLPALWQRLQHVMDSEGQKHHETWEVVFVNDGSTDGTHSLLKSFFDARPHHCQVVTFNTNYGQHMAIVAGFWAARGETVLTMDADLQNPPEEIPKILHMVRLGHDYVGSYRLKRNDHWFRTYASKMVNSLRSRVTSIYMTDHGCMLRAYSRPIVRAVLETEEISTMVPVLAYTFASNPTEVGIEHVERKGDVSKYTFYKLIRLNFDLFTGFSLVPLQIFTVFGMIAALLSGGLFFYLLLRRVFLGPEAEGVFTLFALVFFLISGVIVGIGLLGEYVGRSYALLQRRPRFLVREYLYGHHNAGIASSDDDLAHGVSDAKQHILHES